MAKTSGIYRVGRIWYADYIDIHGHRVRESLHLTDENLAVIAIGQIQSKIERQRVGLDVPTPHDVWQARIDRARATNSEATLRLVLPLLERIRAYIGEDLTARKVHEYIIHRRTQGTKPSTVNYELSLIRSMLPLAERVQVRPLRDRDMTAHERRRRFLSPEQARQLEDACEGEVKRIVKALILTGCRRSEILGIEWQHVGAGTLTIPNIKTVRNGANSHRTIPLHPDLVADLAQARAAGLPRPWPWSRTHYDLTRYVRTAGYKAGLGKVTPHTLRRTFVSWLAPKVGIDTVSKWVGHSNVAITSRLYSYTLPDAGNAMKDISY